MKKTVILNGSPKGNVKNSGTYLMAQAFTSGMSQSCDILPAARLEKETLINAVAEAERIIIMTPNYIHAVPSGVLELLYALPRAKDGQSIGLIIQSGYPESSESELICRYFERLAKRRGYALLGTVIKGECAGLAIMPDKFGKLLASFKEFGAAFDKSGVFDKAYIERFAEPVYLSASQTRMLNFVAPLSKALGWNKVLKANGAFKQRFDTPYLEKN